MSKQIAKYVNRETDSEVTCSKQKLPYLLSKEQLLMILDVCVDMRMAMVIFLGTFQGMRIKEILMLKWKDVDLDYGEIRINDAKNVNRYKSGYGKDRLVPLNDMFIPVLRKWKKMNEGMSEYVIPINTTNSRSDKEVVRGFQIKFLDYLDRVGLKILESYQSNNQPRYKYHLHTLRHVCGTNLYRLGLDIFKIKDFLGHSDIETTNIYCQLATDDLRKASHLAYAYPKSQAPIPEAQHIEVTVNKEILELQNQILDKKMKLMQLSRGIEVPYVNLSE